jgi:hypothetical protein
MRKTTVTFVDVSEVYSKLGFTEDLAEYVYQVGFSNVSFGDADFTLVGNNVALECIVEGVFSYYDFLNAEDAEPSRNIPAKVWNEEELRAAFWQVVGKDDYINLEG